MNSYFFFLACFFAFGFANATEVAVGLASNFSETSLSNTNPFGNYFRDAIDLALLDNKQCLQKRNISISLLEFDYGNSQLNIARLVENQKTSKVIATIGYNLSSQALLAAPVHNALRIPAVITSATADRLGQIGRYIHLVAFNNSSMGKNLAFLATKKFKIKSPVIIVAEDCAYCTDLAGAFESEYLKLNKKNPERVSILNSQTNFSSFSSNKKILNADAIILPNYELVSARVVLAISKLGKKIPFFGGDGWGDSGDEFLKILKGSQFEAYAVSHWNINQKNLSSINFLKNYRERFKKDPNDTAVLAYDGMTILLKNICELKEFTRDALEERLNAVKVFQGITGSFKYKLPNRAPDKSFILLKYTDGKVSIVD